MGLSYAEYLDDSYSDDATTDRATCSATPAPETSPCSIQDYYDRYYLFTEEAEESLDALTELPEAVSERSASEAASAEEGFSVHIYQRTGPEDSDLHIGTIRELPELLDDTIFLSFFCTEAVTLLQCLSRTYHTVQSNLDNLLHAIHLRVLMEHHDLDQTFALDAETSWEESMNEWERLTRALSRSSILIEDNSHTIIRDAVLHAHHRTHPIHSRNHGLPTSQMDAVDMSRSNDETAIVYDADDES